MAPVVPVVSVAQVVWPLPVEPVLSDAPLLEAFDIGHLGRATARFDEAELERLNASILHQTPYAAVSGRTSLSEAEWDAVRGNLHSVAEAEQWAAVIHGPLSAPALEAEDAAYVAQAAETLAALPFDAGVWGALTEALGAPNGIVLVTGPTGAGKTTTLYAALKLLNDGKRNILTVEDPVEYAVPGVGQTQVDTRVGLTFAQGLRAILRQDPDVVMVGEIRDRETAEIAVQAALTGHLVLSTVHANSAAGAITRLRDFGVETFLIAATLRAVVAQRLARQVCPVCAGEEPLAAPLASRLGLPAGIPVAKANGCPSCRQTGYLKRRGLFELITADGPVRNLINEGAGEGRLEAAGLHRSLKESAREAVRARRTTPTEVLPLFQGEPARDLSHAGVAGGINPAIIPSGTP